ncbi:MAG: sugar isomerase [Spirochaetaceae bacterium]|nr:MAG: sugar isomerase [Spirochaetaceae bacterium]
MNNRQMREPHVGLAFSGRRRPGFDQDYGARMEHQVRDSLRNRSFSVTEARGKLVDEQSAREILDQFRRAGVDVPLFLQCTMGDGRLAPTIAARWNSPVVLWATPENPEGAMISSCSLVGSHNWASIMIRSGLRPAVVYGDPQQPVTAAAVETAIRSAFAAACLQRSRLGVVGGAAPGFLAMEVDPFQLRGGLGVQHQSISLAEFGAALGEIPEADVKADLAVALDLKLPLQDVVESDLVLQSRFYLVLKQFFCAQGFDALALRCWPEIPNDFGQWPYLAMTRLADEGYAIAMEGDAYGALGSYLAEQLGMGRCYISDWLAHDCNSVTLWHAGNLPFSLSPPVGTPGGPVVARHFNVPRPAVIESTLQPGMPVTLFRIWHGADGLQLVAMEGTSIEPRRTLMGTNGLVMFERRDIEAEFLRLVRAGMPHHVSLCKGHHAARLAQAADLLGIRVTTAC